MQDDRPLFPIPPDRVLQVVADAYGLSVPELLEVNRQRPTSDARRVALRLLNEESWLSWNRSGMKMGHPNGSGGTVKRYALEADEHALEVLRYRLRPNGSQEALW